MLPILNQRAGNTPDPPPSPPPKKKYWVLKFPFKKMESFWLFGIALGKKVCHLGGPALNLGLALTFCKIQMCGSQPAQMLREWGTTGEHHCLKAWREKERCWAASPGEARRATAPKEHSGHRGTASGDRLLLSSIESQLFFASDFFLNLFVFNWRIIAYNIVLVSATHQHELAIGIPTSPPSWTSLPPPTPTPLSDFWYVLKHKIKLLSES